MNISAIRGLRVASMTHLDDEALLLRALVDEVVLADVAAARSRKSGAFASEANRLGEFRAVAFAETRDQRFLAIEINVERAGLTPRFPADRLHRRGVKPAARETAQRRVENVLSPRALRLWLKLWHRAGDVPT